MPRHVSNLCLDLIPPKFEKFSIVNFSALTANFTWNRMAHRRRSSPSPEHEQVPTSAITPRQPRPRRPAPNSTQFRSLADKSATRPLKHVLYRTLVAVFDIFSTIIMAKRWATRQPQSPKQKLPFQSPVQPKETLKKKVFCFERG